MKEYRKILSVMLVFSMLVTSTMLKVCAADIVPDYENTGAGAAEVTAETEENTMESDTGTEGQEESETEEMVSEGDDGKKTVETVSENTESEDADEEPEGDEADETREEVVEPERETVVSADTVTAEATVADEEELSGSCGANVTWRLADGVLTISGSGAMDDYELIGEEIAGPDITNAPWYTCRLDINQIIIKEGVTSLGDAAFCECNRLTSITIPEGIISIGDCAFAGCNSLTDISIPQSVEFIGFSAFYGCSCWSGSVAIPKGVTTIGYATFLGCTRLTYISIPDGVLSIGDSAFTYCNGLTSILIPSSVTSIESGAFMYCDKLSDVYYGGNEIDWRTIMIGDDNECLTNATIHYNSTGGVDSTLIIKEQPFVFTDPQMVRLTWGWNYILNHKSTEYIHDVSTVALALSAAAECSQSTIETMLVGDNFGLDLKSVKSINYDKDEQEINHPACTFAHKTINNGGQTEHVIVIVGRGTSSFTDGITDCCSITDHFIEPASNVWRSFLGWLATNGLDNQINGSNTKFFVTGHSLGGAIANRIAYRLTQDYGEESVYAYTFASPPTEGGDSTIAPNIFNLLCYGDPVPYLGAFTDGRYGTDLWFGDSYYSCHIHALFPDSAFFDNHLVGHYMSHLQTISNNKFRAEGKSGGAWCPVDLRIYNSSGELVGSVTDNAVDQENVTDSVLIVLSGENKDQKNFYFFDDDTYDIELIGKDSGTLTYTIRDTSADKQNITERVYANVALTQGKRMTSSVSVWDKTDLSISTEGKIDTPQVQLLVLDEAGDIVREVLPDGTGTEVPYTGPNEVLPSDIPADGKIPDGLWIAGVADSYTYTGVAIKPEIRVYDGKKRLKSGKDYTVSYKNNTKANDAVNPSAVPAVIVKGRGNYAGTETATFQIMAVALDDVRVSAEAIIAACNKKVQKKVPVVTYNGRKLAKNRDFTVSYPNGEAGAYKEVGSYDILLTAKAGGNFSGTRTVRYTITDNTLLAKVSVKKLPNQTYTGKAIEPALTVTYKNTPLVKGMDYTVSYTDNTEIGKANAVLTGIGKYAGTKRVSFKITGTSLKGATVSGIVNKTYNGGYQRQDMTVTLQGRTLAEDTDYEVDYAGNKAVGKASVTIKGKGAYTGTVKKTFRIAKFDIAANAEGRFTAEVKQETVPYAKGGAKPTVAVRFKIGTGRWQTLVEGRDYTLSYRNHTAVNDGSRADRCPTVMVKGKGSFCGTYNTALSYQIKVQDMGRLTLKAQDKNYRNQKNIFATKVIVTDLDGKVLKAGTDYNKTAVYTYVKETAVNTAGGGTIMIIRAAGDVVDKNDVIPAGTVLQVQVQAKEGGNYTGTLAGEYRIAQAAIASASVSIPKQMYTGQPVTLEKNQFVVKVRGKQLDESQYEIVQGSYKNNVKKGTASMTIRGLDNYGGTKIVTFTIRAKGFFWWWR